MIDEPSDELLDLRATEKGIGLALYASETNPGGNSSSCTLSSSLCCSFHLCI